jgi:hypothetical protein
VQLYIPITPYMRTSLIVYEADIFNCFRHVSIRELRLKDFFRKRNSGDQVRPGKAPALSNPVTVAG